MYLEHWTKQQRYSDAVLSVGAFTTVFRVHGGASDVQHNTVTVGYRSVRSGLRSSIGYLA